MRRPFSHAARSTQHASHNTTMSASRKTRTARLFFQPPTPRIPHGADATQTAPPPPRCATLPASSGSKRKTTAACWRRAAALHELREAEADGARSRDGGLGAADGCRRAGDARPRRGNYPHGIVADGGRRLPHSAHPVPPGALLLARDLSGHAGASVPARARAYRRPRSARQGRSRGKGRAAGRADFAFQLPRYRGSRGDDQPVQHAGGDGAGAQRVHAIEDDSESGVAIFQFLYSPRRVSRRRTRTVRSDDGGVLRISEIREALRAPIKIGYKGE